MFDLKEGKGTASMGLSDGDCKCFPDEVAARAWMDEKIASEGMQAGGRSWPIPL